MKKWVVLTLAFIFGSNLALSSDVLTGITLSPFVFATKLIEVTSVGIGKMIASTSSLVQSRSFAEKEKLKDEVLELNQAIISRGVISFEEIEDNLLKELFYEILSNEKMVNEVHNLVSDGDIVYKLTVVMMVTLFVD